MRTISIAVLLSVVCAFSLPDTTDIPNMRADEIEKGMTGYLLTTLEDYTIDTIEVVLEGKSSIIVNFKEVPVGVIRGIKGPKKFPVEHTGIIAGESGSPTYIYTNKGIKRLGALAYVPRIGDKDPIALVQLSETMINGGQSLNGVQKPQKTNFSFDAFQQPLLFSGPFPLSDGAKELFTQNNLNVSDISFASLGEGGKYTINYNGSIISPGSAINVYLITGDINLFANGTVTMVGDSVFYAFGHRFRDTGPTSLPVTRARMITSIANTYGSYKFPESNGEFVGAIEHDYFWGIKGTLGKKADMILFSATLRSGESLEEFNSSIARVPGESNWLMTVVTYLTLFGGYQAFDLVQTEEGSAKIVVTLEIDGLGQIQIPPYIVAYSNQNAEGVFVKYVLDLLNKVFTPLSENGLPLISINFDIEYSAENEFLKLVRTEIDPEKVKPGETAELLITLQAKESDEGQDAFHTIIPFTVPNSAAPENVPIQIKTGDNLLWRPSKGGEKLSSEQVLLQISSFTNTVLFVKAEFDQSSANIFSKLKERKYKIVVGDTKWERIHREKQEHFYIPIFKHVPTPGNEIRIIANSNLTIMVEKGSFLPFFIK